MDYVVMLENCREKIGQEQQEAEANNALEVAINNFDTAWEKYYATKLY